ncbi:MULTISPECIES: hypothetical protein [unclassified Pseudoalteromonas]|uniref:hypothetical protein n=1 Tax=unclassified Pseudoalteromonas TaxID=194690 RepID=UPI001F25E2FE|nr:MULTISPECIES: hypothetical protein [unclassified Pseudoalteromonas]MCF2829416.1 hypothetical protein [Pseudoalteromonas sp. OF5H-5]MCF2831384.1 hypothetical protein [Pseudoalteromonas sp. DL2-H6]MCF2927053.1 hypothetical protein [Pseudoalteromonas sp. DL2-H1]
MASTMLANSLLNYKKVGCYFLLRSSASGAASSIQDSESLEGFDVGSGVGAVEMMN